MTKRMTVDPSVPAQSEFTLKAIRNISGLVTIYDPTVQHLIPVPGIVVLLRELGRECVADKNGTYLFRDLPPGVYSLVIVYQGKETKKMITVPDGPAFPRNVDINLVGK
jgi:carboxypeptidase family protein